jgi:hypothetical protein
MSPYPVRPGVGRLPLRGGVSRGLEREPIRGDRARGGTRDGGSHVGVRRADTNVWRPKLKLKAKFESASSYVRFQMPGSSAEFKPGSIRGQPVLPYRCQSSRGPRRGPRTQWRRRRKARRMCTPRVLATPRTPHAFPHAKRLPLRLYQSKRSPRAHRSARGRRDNLRLRQMWCSRTSSRPGR